MAKKVLITGGSGFIGSKLATILKESNQDFLYTYNKSNLSELVDEGLKINLLNASDFEKYKKELHEVTDLIHAAALVPSNLNNVGDELDSFNAYVKDSVTMLRNILFALPNLKRIVYISSCYIVLQDKNVGFYGVGKSINEDLVHRFAKLRGIDSISLRFPQIYGPGETHGIYINKFIRLALEGHPINLDERAHTKRDALYIDDVTDAIYRSLSIKGNRTITISSNEPYSVFDVAEAIKRKTNVEIQMPISLMKDMQDQHFNSTYNDEEFHVQYTLDNGLDRTIDYYRKITE